MEAAPPLRSVRDRFAQDVHQALGRVPPEIADSALGHAVLAEALVSTAAEILRQHGNVDFLDTLVQVVARRDELTCGA